ncbi:hypothetical protein SK128_017013 [Halocaridina rubra]|uniref:Uncharacterized protein n=1 Tax=Halocaridina rubra TaxID=373956 RepID=A0AAN8X671_HALRR
MVIPEKNTLDKHNVSPPVAHYCLQNFFIPEARNSSCHTLDPVLCGPEIVAFFLSCLLSCLATLTKTCKSSLTSPLPKNVDKQQSLYKSSCPLKPYLVQQPRKPLRDDTNQPRIKENIISEKGMIEVCLFSKDYD